IPMVEVQAVTVPATPGRLRCAPKAQAGHRKCCVCITARACPPPTPRPASAESTSGYGYTHEGWHCSKPLPRLPGRGNGSIQTDGGEDSAVWMCCRDLQSDRVVQLVFQRVGSRAEGGHFLHLQGDVGI